MSTLEWRHNSVDVQTTSLKARFVQGRRRHFSYDCKILKGNCFKSFQLHTCDLPQISYCHYALLVCHTTGASSMTSLRSSSCLCTAHLVSKVEASYVRHCGSCSFCAACQSYSCCLYFVGPFPGWESASRQISVFCACTVDLVLLCVLLLTARINMIQNCCVLMFHLKVD